MKSIRTLAFATLLGMATLGIAQASPDHDTTPKHGGIVTVVKDIDYELVARPDRLTLHVRDHGKVVDLSQASAKVTLLTAGQKQEAALAPAGTKLEATGQFKIAKGTRLVALISLPGKAAITARFEVK